MDTFFDLGNNINELRKKINFQYLLINNFFSLLWNTQLTNLSNFSGIKVLIYYKTIIFEDLCRNHNTEEFDSISLFCFSKLNNSFTIRFLIWGSLLTKILLLVKFFFPVVIPLRYFLLASQIDSRLIPPSQIILCILFSYLWPSGLFQK